MLPLRLEQFWAVSAGGARSGIALGSRGTLVTGPSKSELYIKFNSRPPMALAITAGTNHTPSCFTVLAGRAPICLSLTRRFTSNFCPVLAFSAHRIRSLYVSTELADDIELLWAELSWPAPNL